MDSMTMFSHDSVIPLPLTAMLGRDDDLAAIRGSIDQADARLITLTGPGGVGKTRLALEVAAVIEADDPNRPLFVPLADVFDSTLVLPAVAAALGLRDEAGLPLVERVAVALRGRRAVLILDNLEQVLAAAPTVARLLERCPDLSILATSRAPLRIRGEREYPLGPLPAPDLAALPPVAAIAGHASVALFADRARAVDPSFVISTDNAASVATLCAQLDGLPLAIELAAAWTKLLDPAAMLTTFADRLPLLTRGARDLPDRQRTMRDAIAWSDALLAPPARAIFRRIAVFRGGGDLDAIAAVVSDVAPADPLATFDALSELVDQSLLRGEEERGEASVRFRMLETIREYGWEQLVAHGELDTVRTRHLEFFLTLAEKTEPLLGGPEQAERLRHLDREADNVRTALAFAIERGRAQTALRLGLSLLQYWGVRGRLRQESVWLEQALTVPAERVTEPIEDQTLRARALGALGIVAYEAGDYQLARQQLGVSLEMRRTLADQPGTANMLNNLALVATAEGDHQLARRLLDESIAIRRVLGVDRFIATALVNLGDILNSLRDHESARAALTEALELAERRQDPRLRANAIVNLAETAAIGGDFATARQLSEEALAVLREIGDRFSTCSCLLNLARFESARENHDQATRLLAEAIVLLREHGSPATLADVLDALVAPVVNRGDPELAARLLGGADALRSWRGAALGPVAQETRVQAERSLRTRLLDRRRDAAVAAGRAWTLEQATAEALAAALAPPAVRAVDPSPQPSTSNDYGLTPRELEVLRLLVEAKTDREIGDDLFISPRTAMSHVSSILGKLGVETRTGAATYAVRHALV